MNRRTLLLLIVTILIVVVAAIFFARGRSSSAPVATPVPTTSALSAAKQQAIQDHATLVAYAGQLAPVLQQSANLMNQSLSKAATAQNRAQLDAVCSNFGPRVSALEDEVAGVQFPNIGTPARRFRHKLLGVYHLYLGATIEGHTAYENGDPSGAANAISDLARAARQMQAITQTAVTLSNQKHSA